MGISDRGWNSPGLRTGLVVVKRGGRGCRPLGNFLFFGVGSCRSWLSWVGFLDFVRQVTAFTYTDFLDFVD